MATAQQTKTLFIDFNLLKQQYGISDDQKQSKTINWLYNQNRGLKGEITKLKSKNHG